MKYKAKFYKQIVIEIESNDIYDATASAICISNSVLDEKSFVDGIGWQFETIER